MPSPPPDPNGRPPSAPDAPQCDPAKEPAASAQAPAPAGSTGSHHPARAEPISDLLRGSGSSKRRVPATDSALLQMLGMPGASPIDPVSPAVPQNSDDSPTVITRSHPPSPAPAPLPGDVPSIGGRRLGHFELIEAIGSGGMAAVLKARDLELDRLVALKILPPEAARDPEGVSRFKQEARAAAMLDHENIARVYFCGEDQGLHFIAFEFVEGENLRQLIDRRGTVPPADCVRYMIQLAAGLSHANERGVVHRDIKPSNIIITPDGRAKIVDMGLARQLDTINGGVTHSGVTLGTFDYISPEQALDPRRADVRSDIYSLGCAFYHALTGRPPVPEGTAAKKLHAHQHLDPLDPRAINPAIPDELAAVLSGMMAKNPVERYQTPFDLIAHLKGAAERMMVPLDFAASDSAVQAVPASPVLPTEPPQLKFAWAIAAAAAMIAIAAIALSPPNQSFPSRPPWGQDQVNGPFDPPTGSAGNGPPIVEQPSKGVVAVSTAQGLAEALADRKTREVHLQSGVYDLTQLTTGVSFTGNELHLVGSPSDVTKIILHGGHASNPGSRLSAGRMVIQAAKLRVQGIDFEIVAHPFQEDQFVFGGWPSRSAGLAVDSTSQVDIVDCRFVNKTAPEEEPVTLAVSPPTDSRIVHVRIERSLFVQANNGRSGGVAIQVPAGARVDVDDSGFGPHGAAIQVLSANDDVQASPTVPSTKVNLYRSSFMLEPRSAAVAAFSTTELAAGYSLFASVGSEIDPLPSVFQVARLDGSKYSGLGQKNAYHQVNALAIGVGEAAASYSFEECRTRLLPAADTGSVALAQRPWTQTKPLEALDGAEPWQAFSLDTLEPNLSVPDREIAIVGVQFHSPGTTTRRTYSSVPWPPPNLPKQSSATEPRQLVWFPQPEAKDAALPKDTYSDLSTLLKAARNGDTILIRHTGLLHLERTIEIEKPRGMTGDFKLTFKPFNGSKPILTGDADGARLDQTLFRLLGGEVAFEGVQFLLKPSRPKNLQTVTAVAVVGGKGCSFTNCVLTLLEEDDAKVIAVVVADPDKVMAMERDRPVPVPDVKFDRCIVRGKGRGIWVPVSRAVRVEIGHSLAAIDGPLFLSEAATKLSSTARSTLKLSHVTAFVGGPIVEMRGAEKAEKMGEMGMSGLVQMETEIGSCLLVAVPGAGQPIVELDGIDPSETTTLLPWRTQPGNRYANFDGSAAPMIVRPSGEGAPPREWKWDRWLAFAGEPAGSPVGTATFRKGPTNLRDLSALKPSDITVKESNFPELPGPKPTENGVDPKLLPEPWESD
jgi:serine/threonine protein kinase